MMVPLPPTEFADLAGQLELHVLPGGTPANPLVVIELDRWRDTPPELIRRAADLVAGALPVTVGLLTGPPSAGLAPLITAATLTLADQTVPDGGMREIVPAGDIPGAPDAEEALGRLRAAVERSPRAAIACGQLVRQTAVLDTAGGLAAEAAAYSLLLGGPEFARWLGQRGAPRRREPPGDPVRVSRDGGRLSIILNDPARRNAFSARLREALLDAVLVGEVDETIDRVELSGAGPAFCSGGDLDEFGTADDLVAAYLVRLSRAPWRVIDRIAAKVTVLAHGACIGAGTEMAAYAGRVVAAPDAFFGLPEVGMGLVPGAGGSVSVPRRTGRWRAAWLMLTGDRLPAAAALRWGLVDELTPARALPVAPDGTALLRERGHALDHVLADHELLESAGRVGYGVDDAGDATRSSMTCSEARTEAGEPSRISPASARAPSTAAGTPALPAQSDNIHRLWAPETGHSGRDRNPNAVHVAGRSPVRWLAGRAFQLADGRRVRCGRDRCPDRGDLVLFDVRFPGSAAGFSPGQLDLRAAQKALSHWTGSQCPGAWLPKNTLARARPRP